jgi:hypothetical protein
LVLAGAAPPYGSLYGYATVSGDREKALETQFLDIPSSQGALDTATVLATLSRYPGSPGDHQAAIYLRDQLQSFGFTATLETLTARVDAPKRIGLTLYPAGRTATYSTVAKVEQRIHGIFSRHNRPPKTKPPHHRVAAAPKPSPTALGAPGASATPALPTPVPVAIATASPTPAVTLDLREPALDADPDTARPSGLPFLAGSADGDLTAPLVYAGFGSEGDYAFLAAHGVDVHGTVAIVRAGREFRGLTARRAQAHGVAGVLFYDDPAEDGPERGASYPNGPFRPATAVRRGTLGEGVTIPVLPVSAATAQTLLRALHGPSAAPPWRGGLPVSYAIARGPASVHLTVQLTRKPTTLWNTIGVMTGTHPEQTIVLGAHRDAWVYGASDNGSGIETLVEAARGLGYLAKNGWQPRRTIVIAGWDGEEIGGYGTIAYANQHGDDLRLGGVAYLDAEHTVIGGRFGADTVAAIAGTVADATHMVDDPAQPGGTLFDRWGRFSFVLPPRGLESRPDQLPTSLFGIGIPAANAGFGGAFGVANSAYDTLTYAQTYADPQFALHRAAGQLYGVLALRLADADVVPYRFSAYVPLLQYAVRSLAARARTAKLHVDANGFGVSIARFNAAAIRIDTATATATDEAAGDRALEAARVLDVAVYGSDGYDGGALPELAHAVAGGSQSEIDGATARTRAAIDRATQLIARTP